MDIKEESTEVIKMTIGIDRFELVSVLFSYFYF